MNTIPEIEMQDSSASERGFDKPHLVWIQPGLLKALDQATWIEMTREIRMRGWEVSLITTGPSCVKQINDVEVECIPTINFYFLRQAVFNLRVFLIVVNRREEIDVLLFHQLTAPWILPLKLLRRFRNDFNLVFVLDTRTVPMELKNKSSLKDRIRTRFYQAIGVAGNFVSDGQTTITGRLAEMVHIPQESLWGTWPSGVDPERFKVSIRDRTWPGEKDAIQIMYIGILHYERNLMQLARAILRANQDGMKFFLSLIGWGTEQPALEEIANRYPQYIDIHHPVPHIEIPSCLAKAHVGALPFPDLPQFRVSSPIKLFEYMASALPIFATRIDCHMDVIKDGNYVFWAEDASEEGLLVGLHQIWEKRASLQQMGMDSLKAVDSWTWGKSAEKLLQALEYGIAKRRVDVEILSKRQPMTRNN